MKLVAADHPALRQRADEVSAVTSEIRKTAKQMLDNMYAGNGTDTGMGLAANQVGILQRIIVLDGSRSRNQPIVMINPEILKAKGEQVWEEGCLSFPGKKVKIKRAKQIIVKYFDLDEDENHVSFNGLMAQCIQHEIDHLNGVCIVDYIGKETKQ